MQKAPARRQGPEASGRSSPFVYEPVISPMPNTSKSLRHCPAMRGLSSTRAPSCSAEWIFLLAWQGSGLVQPREAADTVEVDEKRRKGLRRLSFHDREERQTGRWQVPRLLKLVIGIILYLSSAFYTRHKKIPRESRGGFGKERLALVAEPRYNARRVSSRVKDSI